MNREQIEKAAQIWAKGEITKSRIERAERAFKVGSEWRINAVWHDDISECENKKLIFVEFRDKRVGLYTDVRDLKGIEDIVLRWAYVDDLLPER